MNNFCFPDNCESITRQHGNFWLISSAKILRFFSSFVYIHKQIKLYWKLSCRFNWILTILNKNKEKSRAKIRISIHILNFQFIYVVELQFRLFFDLPIFPVSVITLRPHFSFIFRSQHWSLLADIERPVTHINIVYVWVFVSNAAISTSWRQQEGPIISIVVTCCCYFCYWHSVATWF